MKFECTQDMEKSWIKPFLSDSCEQEGWGKILDLAECGFIILDNQERIMHWNTWAARHSGIEKDKALGRPLADLFGPSLSRRLGRAVERALVRRQTSFLSPSLNRNPLPLFTPEGTLGRRTPISQSITVKPFDIGGPWPGSMGGGRYCLIQIADMTHAELRDSVLRHQATELSRVVTDLKRARDTANQANLAKSQFLTNMSHELRTPLNTIVGFSQLIQMHNRNEVSKEILEYVGYIKDAGENLLKMVIDILDLSKIEIDRMIVNMEIVEVERFLLGCIKTARQEANAAGIILQYVPPDDQALLMKSDSVRLAQIMTNLLSNAIKYNRPGGNVTVSAETTTDGRVRISVADTGMGIPQDRDHELFQSFKRLGAEYSEIPGAGIGLALSRNLARLLGGDMGYRSVPNRGSTFWVDIPAVTESLEQTGEGAPVASPGVAVAPSWSVLAAFTPLTLLYIENGPVNIRLLEALFSSIPKARVVGARWADEGLRLARKLKPSIIVLDIHLPRVGGYTVLEQLRADPETRDIPVIALGAYSVPEDIEQGLAAGFRGWLNKPLDVNLLLDTLVEVLSDRGPKRLASSE